MRRLSKSDRRNSSDLDLRGKGYPQTTQIAQTQKSMPAKSLTAIILIVSFCLESV
jgi:hypothetical protein